MYNALWRMVSEGKGLLLNIKYTEFFFWFFWAWANGGTGNVRNKSLYYSLSHSIFSKVDFFAVKNGKILE